MTDEPKVVGKWWKVVCAVIGALAGLMITANDDLFELLGLGPQSRFPYQVLGMVGGGYIGAVIGKVIDRKKHQGQQTQKDSGA